MQLRIKQILKQLGLTQQELADRLGCSLQNVKNTLCSDSMNLANLERYASALDVPVWQLFISPTEATEQLKPDYFALIRTNGKTFCFESEEELRAHLDGEDSKR